MGTEKAVSKDSSPVPLADANDNEHSNDTEATSVIVATVHFVLSLF